jgi:hypothetical protein
MKGGDSYLLDRAQAATTAMAVNGAVATWEGTKWLANTTHPVLVVFIVGLAALWLRNQSPGKRASWFQIVGQALQIIAELQELAKRSGDEFAAYAPSSPALPDLAETIGNRQALKRACLYSLARERTPTLSTRQLVDSLPTLGVGQSESLVRETLRGCKAFEEIPHGRWRVGKNITPPI